MTANPRALEVACIVLDSLTDDVRENIRNKGIEMTSKLGQLMKEFPNHVLSVQGTGLLCSIELNPKTLPVCGYNRIEENLRKDGIGVIHGGKNALRFTPHFKITSKEIDLIIEFLRKHLSLA